MLTFDSDGTLVPPGVSGATEQKTGLSGELCAVPGLPKALSGNFSAPCRECRGA